MNNKNLFTIGEIAKSIGITRKIILNYETKGLIKPDKKDGTTGNRYYTIDTFTQIRTIRVLQKLGLSLDEAREYFNDNSDLQPIITRLENMRDELNLTIEKLKERTHKENETVKEIIIEPQTIYKRIYTSTTVEEKTVLLRNTAFEAVRKHGTDTTRRMYFTEYTNSCPKETSYCVAIPPESDGKNVLHLPQLNAISIFHHGPYETIANSRNKLIQYANVNGINLSGTFRNLYIEGPPQHKDKNNYITQIIAIIE